MARAATQVEPTSLGHVYPDSLKTLISTLQSHSALSPAQVKAIILESEVSMQDLMPWADFDHPVTDSYGRKLVFDGGHFEVMVMSWAPGDFSAIHDHGATQWGAVQCFGVAEHYVYQFSKGRITTLKPAHYSPGMVHAVDHSLIHQMGNSSDMPFLSLHVYGCADVKENITGDARIFDLFNGSIQCTDGGVFFCLPAEQINQETYGISGDQETMLRHHQQMSDRIRRILQSHPRAELVQKLTLLQEKISQLSLS